ncbi:MAG: hypothetical protein AVDCRST_MAG68-4585 [uncultured Gemmatimonadetes bacterium]|uniref:Uncharacterized protein n=1 Tax=uncultured Gemmatimonadota bacterium TaxID=203437 RepID=A0A6J4MP11_9BACT|nr:MAG: hypothetical protein AVDCRST_MAG68-4585 [uncultured Gemmatimonadota bacterium]
MLPWGRTVRAAPGANFGLYSVYGKVRPSRLLRGLQTR